MNTMTAKEFQKKYQSKRPESEIQNQIADYLTWKGWLVIRINSGQMQGRAEVEDKKTKEKRKTWFRAYMIMNNKKSEGVSDLIAFKDGKSLFIEVKKKSGRLRKSQKEFRELSKKTGNLYIVAKGIEDVVNSLG